MSAPGRVLNRAALDPPRGEYDFAVIGGGLLGVACAWFLREFAPGKSVLLVEAGGIPSEAGGTHVCPALHHHFFPDVGEGARARWLSAWLGSLAPAGNTRPLFAPVGFLRAAEPGEIADLAVPFGLWREGQGENVRRNVETLFGFPGDAPVRFDPAGGYGNAEALALHLGRAAVGRGLDLMLNARAAFDGSLTTLRLDRLEMNNRMQVETVRQTTVRAGVVVVACGAAGGRLVGDGLGEAVPGLGYFYAQYPRFENDVELCRDVRGVTEMPVVAAPGGFTIRPHGDGALLVPPTPTVPDLEGYVPVGGELFGVRTGLRRELLNPLVDALETLPALGRPALNLGKTVANVRGAWETLTPGGRPLVWRHPGGAPVSLLAGGPHGFSLGIAAACELAHTLSGTDAPLPWVA